MVTWQEENEMKKQQSFSHGLLYSVSPENFSALHLNDKDRLDEFDWQAYESQLAGNSLVQNVLDFLKRTVSRQ
jgi:hypothetical protein